MSKPTNKSKQLHNLKRAKKNKHLRTLQREQKISFKKDPVAFRERRRAKQDKLLESNQVEGTILQKTAEQEQPSQPEGIEILTNENQDSTS